MDQLVVVIEVGVSHVGLGRLSTPVTGHRDPRHVFDATGNDDVVKVGTDVRCGQIERLLSGTAHSIQLEARNSIAPPGNHGCDTSDVRSLFEHRLDAAVHDVLYRRWIEAVTLLQRFQWGCREVLRVRVPKRSVTFSKRCPDGVDNHGFSHGRL